MIVRKPVKRANALDRIIANRGQEKGPELRELPGLRFGTCESATGS
jgi:hypothetical protein